MPDGVALPGTDWTLCAVRLPAARELLHDTSVPVALWRQRERYALLVAVTRALGRRARAAAEGHCLPIHATPGHSVLMYRSGAAERVERVIEDARRWLAGLGVRTEVRRAPATAGLDAVSWPRFVAAWTEVQRDARPKAELRTGFAAAAPVSLDVLRAALDRGPGGDPLAALVDRERRAVLRAWQPAGLPAFLAHMPVETLLADEVVPGGLAVARLDVSGFRAGLLRGVGCGAELLGRGAELGLWFLSEVPRLVAGVNRGRPAAHRAGVLLSVCDDIALAGSVSTLEAARRVLARAWGARDVGELRAGVSPPGAGGTLGALSRAALADLTARADRPGRSG